MSWRNLLVDAIDYSLANINDCISEHGVEEVCAEMLVESIDSVYSPLGLIANRGYGEAKKLASSLIGIVSAYFVSILYKRGYSEKDLEKIYNYVKNLARSRSNNNYPVKLLVEDFEEYLSSNWPKNKRSWKTNPDVKIARLLRELGSEDRVLARALLRILRNKYSY